MTAGYLGTPLARKLGLKDGMRVWFDAMPDSVRAEIAAEGMQLAAPEPPVDIAHIFVTSRGELEAKLHHLLPVIARDGAVWVSWPKKASKMSTDITEDVIREVALPMGLVDVKVCAVDNIW